MSQNHEQKEVRWRLLLIVVLAGIALLATVLGTMAWLFPDRSLTTLTKIDYVTLTLEGKTEDSVPINLGVMETSTKSKKMPFRIVTKKSEEYVLQLAHTTNLPLQYEIYKADKWPENAVENKKNIIKNATDEEEYYRDATYNKTDKVQPNAQPLYWTSGTCTADAQTGIDYYVLVVSWKDDNPSVINKDTEMIYLSASLTGGATNAETSTSQP